MSETVKTQAKYFREKIDAFTDTERKAWAEKVPEEDIGSIYDKDDNVLMGSRFTKGKVKYIFVKPELVDNGKPIYLGWTIAYDGTGNEDLPEDTQFMSFDEFKEFIGAEDEEN